MHMNKKILNLKIKLDGIIENMEISVLELNHNISATEIEMEDKQNFV